MINIYTGVVEDRISDPLKLGRCKVRVFGVHNPDRNILPTDALPWANVLQPIHSAAISGIGLSPTGLVEGSWVVVSFTDVDFQYPIIMGSLAGVPQEKATMEPVDPLSSLAPNEEIVSDTTPTEPAPPTEEVIPTAPDPKLGPVSSFTLSNDGHALIKGVEGIASLSRTRRIIGSASLPDDTPIYSYLDTSNKWTIGWGSTIMPDGSVVNGSSVITKKQADELFKTMLYTIYEKEVKTRTKVMVTQSMYDALVSMAYNMGGYGLFSSPIGTSLNSGRYAEAAAFIPLTRTNNGVLTSRRKKEQAMFVRDGIPNVASGTLDTVYPPEPPAAVIEQPAANLNPVSSTNGFSDASGKYPIYTQEPDTNRLARSENIGRTVVFMKDAARAKAIPIARYFNTAAQKTWDQSQVPYAAAYPYNHVYATQSGHLEEWDDTPGRERTHSFHKSGSFVETDTNGTKVTRVVGDNYEILERNGYVVIRGTCNVTIQGNSNVRIENHSNIEVLGNSHIAVTGNCTSAVGGDFKIKATGDFIVDARNVHLNSNKTGDLRVPNEKAVGLPEFGTLIVPTRGATVDSNYETPEEGSNADFNSASVASGDQTPEDTTANTTTPISETTVTQSTPTQSDDICGIDITGATRFTSSFQLTTNTTLGKACVGESGIPNSTTYGTTANEVVCNLKHLFFNCMEPIQRMYPNVTITSTWRSEAVNNRVGGSKTSDHLFGRAADFVLSGFNRKQHYDAIIAISRAIPAYKQLILEYKGSKTWIHISYAANGNKMQCLTIDAAINKTLKSGGFLLLGE